MYIILYIEYNIYTLFKARARIPPCLFNVLSLVVVVRPLGRRPLDRRSNEHWVKNHNEINHGIDLKRVQKSSKIRWKRDNNPSKIVKNHSKWSPGGVKIAKSRVLGVFWGLLGGFGAPCRFLIAPPHQPGNSKGDFGAEMVAPRAHFGPQLGRKGVPKSHLFAKNQHKIAKKSLQEGFQKKHENLVENSLKNE